MIAAFYDVIVIGSGPAGLAAALAADGSGAKTLLVEREAKPGGILKQCIHDGFGLVRFGEKLTGPEYAYRFIRKLSGSGIETAMLTFVTKLEQKSSGNTPGRFLLTLVNRDGIVKTECKSIVLACGCRERSSRQIGIHGRHSAGILTAGAAQYYTNIIGKMPGKRCLILGSGDIGLIMARRLKLEGAEVLGVYEARTSAGGLTRNVYQCLEDFNIPLHTGKTVTRVFGEGHISAVEISRVNADMTPVPGTAEIIECDALILSVGLIPENELAQSIGIALDKRTGGPLADQNCMTMTEGVFCCGNALHVSDLVDYVSENGETAGRAAAKLAAAELTAVKLAAAELAATELAAAELATAKQAGEYPSKCRSVQYVEINFNEKFLYIVPQMLDLNDLNTPVIFYFRSKEKMDRTLLTVSLDGTEIYKKTYPCLRPPEMERLELDFTAMDIRSDSVIEFALLPAAAHGVKL